MIGITLMSQFLLGMVAVIAAFFYWINRRQDYFKNAGIPYVSSTPLLGTFRDVLFGKIAFYNSVVEIYNRSEVKDKPFFGIHLFHKPGLMITDPELIKKILVKDFNSFPNRYASSDVHDPLGYYNLFSVKAPLWKLLRGKLSPFFSSGKLKLMFYLVDKNSSNLINYIHSQVEKTNNKVEMEMKQLATLYTTDVIANCAYGVEANSFENPDGEFHKAGHSMFNMTFWRGFEQPAFFMLPQVMKLFGFLAFSSASTNFIVSTISHVMEEREKSGSNRNDLIDTLIEMKNADNKDKSENLTMDMLIAQAAVFFSAGYETSSATQSFLLYEVACNEDVQEKLRGEIRDMLVRTEGRVTYEAVMDVKEMPYLHQVIHETLRLYPILPVLDRQCINPQGYSLEPFSDFVIPHGMPIYVPFFAIQRDEKNFADPLKFDPERFSPENIGNIKPFTHAPFGSGPRNCIGERFALMQVKTAIAKILKDFRLEKTAKTPERIVFEKKAMLVQSDKGLFINLVHDPLYEVMNHNDH